MFFFNASKCSLTFIGISINDKFDTNQYIYAICSLKKNMLFIDYIIHYVKIFWHVSYTATWCNYLFILAYVYLYSLTS